MGIQDRKLLLTLISKNGNIQYNGIGCFFFFKTIQRMRSSIYAMMLIQMEAERGGLAPLCSGLLSKLGKNAMEERITAIMKIKKKSTFAGIVAAVLVISVAAAFATSATGAAGITEIKQGNKTTKETEAEKAKGIQQKWCSLDYSFSYHISDKEKVSIGERDDQVGVAEIHRIEV